MTAEPAPIQQRHSGPEAGPQAGPGAATRLSLLQAANFAGIGLYLPFFPVWLSHQGLSDRQIGLALALGMVVRMLASQPLAALGDRKPGAVRTLILLQIASAAAYGVLMLLSSPHAIIAGSVAVALLSAGIIPLGDFLVSAQVRRDPRLDYARIRVWGSVSFLVVSLAGGWLIAAAGPAAVAPGLIACCLVAAVAARMAPDAHGHEHVLAAQAGGGDDPDRRTLLWLLIIASALVNASHAALYGFGTLYWRQIGIGEPMIGGFWAFAVLVEIAMFWLVGPLIAARLRNACFALAAAGVAAALRFLIMPLISDPAAILALQASHALSFGAQHIAVIAAASALAPPGRRALIQGRVSAANACLMGAATLAAGFIYESFGAWAFTAMVPVALAGVAITILSMTLATRASLLDSAGGGALPPKAS